MTILLPDQAQSATAITAIPTPANTASKGSCSCSDIGFNMSNKDYNRMHRIIGIIYIIVMVVAVLWAISLLRKLSA